MDPRRILGLAGEHVAERELERRGFRVVARNVRTRFGEIDLVCRDRGGYAFVEVKTRRAGSFVAAAEAVDARKAARLAALAQSWLGHRGERDAVWRIVIAALTVGAEGTRVELIDLESL
ncbi:MAG: YraN family protein [Chloroflexota bacterium]|nr:YraN family protein [Candidatus Limnocylindria bacterium]